MAPGLAGLTGQSQGPLRWIHSATATASLIVLTSRLVRCHGSGDALTLERSLGISPTSLVSTAPERPGARDRPSPSRASVGADPHPSDRPRGPVGTRESWCWVKPYSGPECILTITSAASKSVRLDSGSGIRRLIA